MDKKPLRSDVPVAEVVPDEETHLGAVLETKGSMTPRDFFALVDQLAGMSKEEIREIEISWERKNKDQRHNLFNVVSDIVADALDKVAVNSQEEAEEFVDTILEEFIGENNKAKWQFISDDDIYRAGKNDDFLVDVLIEKLHHDEVFSGFISPEYANQLFIKIVDDMRERHDEFLEKYHRDMKHFEDEGLVDKPIEQGSQEFNKELYESDLTIAGIDSESYDDGESDMVVIINKAIRAIAPKGNRETIDYLLKFVEKSDLLTVPNLDRAFSKIDPQYAAGKLLEMIKEANSAGEDGSSADQKARRYDLTRILYRLELGNINISEEGVRYFDRLYDLGEQNDPNGFARRLTANGDVGIFDEDKVLQRYFKLDDLTDGQKNVKATVMDFALSQFFSREPNDEKEKEDQQKLLEEFKYHYFDFFNNKFFEETGVQFNNLNFREQAWFMRFVLKGEAETQKRALAVVKKYGENGLKTFIATEIDGGAGEDIFAIAESKMPERTVDNIFGKYARLVEKIDNVEEELKAFFRDQSEDGSFAVRVTSEISGRARIILADFAKTIKTAGDSAQPVSLSKELKEKMKQINVDLVVFASIFKTAYKGKEMVDLSEVRGLALETKDSGELNEAEKAEMRRAFYGNRVEGISREFAETRVKQEFDPIINEPGHSFHMLKHDGAVISFARTDELKNGNLYIGFINSDSQTKGMGIGEAFLRALLRETAKGRDVELKVRTENPSISLYKRLGFKQVGEPYIAIDTKKEYIIMVLPAEQLQEEESKLSEAA